MERIITYQNQTWKVTGEFLSGNGTYDILMLQLQNTQNNTQTTAPAIDTSEEKTHEQK
jgi:hypothetical protein